jgi:hypothetical protein
MSAERSSMSTCDPFRNLALIAILQLGESRPKPVAWVALISDAVDD